MNEKKIITSKKEVRERILKLREELDREVTSLASQIICRKILETGAYDEAKDICLYMPIGNEVDVMLLADIAEESGKKVWVPKVIERAGKGAPGKMIFNRFLGTHGENVVTGEYDILESSSEEILIPDSDTLIIMPGVAFTSWKERIGYGGGFYDRFIADHLECATIAVCYDLQIVEEIPVGKYDIKPDWLVTESFIFR